MAERRCKNWLETFMKWSMPVSEAPESLLIHTGLFCISSVIKRKLKISREFTKQYDIYPFMYILFVGPPGEIRKTTSSGYAEKLLTTLNTDLAVTDPAYVNLGPTSGSYQKLIEKMSETLDGSMTIISGEFGNIVSTSQSDAYDFFSKLFDYSPRIEHATRAHNDEVVLTPCLNLLGCTTPDWMTLNSGYIMGGGFAARTIFLFESKARQYKLFYHRVKLSVEELNDMQSDMVHDLKIIGSLKGEFKPESLTFADEMDEWYQKYRKEDTNKNTETFKARKHVHTIRTAMLLSLCESDELVITRRHFNAAITLMDDVEKGLNRGLSIVSKNPYVQDLYRVLDFIEANGPVSKARLMAAFWQNFQNPAADLASILEVLSVTRQIEEVIDGKDVTIRISKKKLDLF